MIEITTKYEGLPEVIEIQANDIKDLKSDVNPIQAFVILHTLWLNETNKELAIIPIIKDRQEMMMMQMTNLQEFMVNTLQGDDAKRGEETKERRKIVFAIPKSKMDKKPHPYVPSIPKRSSEPRNSTPIRTPTETGD